MPNFTGSRVLRQGERLFEPMTDIVTVIDTVTIALMAIRAGHLPSIGPESSSFRMATSLFSTDFAFSGNAAGFAAANGQVQSAFEITFPVKIVQPQHPSPLMGIEA